MATSKTLTPTNVTIQIPAFTDKPDQRVNSNCIDKEADAINALSDQKANNSIIQIDDESKTSYTFNAPATSGAFEYGLLYGGTSESQTFMYMVFLGANRTVTFVNIFDKGSGRTFTGTWTNSVLTINVSSTCWGGLRLIWAHR